MNESPQPLPPSTRSGSIDPQTVAILHALKGPPASILLTLLSGAEPLGPQQLQVLTGWGETSLIAGLQKLALLGLAERRSRYNGWVLTGLARSTVLPRLFPVLFQAAQGVLDGGNIKFSNSLPSDHPQEDLEPAGNTIIYGSPPSGHPQEDQDLDGNTIIFGSLPSGDPAEDQGLDGNTIIFGSLPSGDSAGDEAFAGSMNIYGSDPAPGDALPAGRQSSCKSQGSRALKARAFPPRLCPSFKKSRARCKFCSSQFPEESQEEDLNLKTLGLSASSGSDFPRPPQNGPQGCLDPPLSSAGPGGDPRGPPGLRPAGDGDPPAAQIRSTGPPRFQASALHSCARPSWIRFLVDDFRSTL
jgi:hypothetical protein